MASLNLPNNPVPPATSGSTVIASRHARHRKVGTDPLAEPAVLAVAGDWHMNTRYAVAAVEYAAGRGVTTILHTGDFGYTFDARFIGRLQHALKAAGITLLFVDGNHEDFRSLYTWPIRDNGLRRLTDRIWHLPRGFRWTWHGTSYLACGGAYSVDRRYREPGVSWWPEEEITDADIVRCSGGADVLLSHDCPSGVPIPGIDDRPMSQAPFPFDDLLRSQAHRMRLRQIVDAVQPARIYHGHYHRNYTTQVDLGYGPVTVTGLDCDGAPLLDNMQVIELGGQQ